MSNTYLGSLYPVNHELIDFCKSKKLCRSRQICRKNVKTEELFWGEDVKWNICLQI